MDVLLLLIHGAIAIAVVRALLLGGRSMLVIAAFLLPLSGLTYSAGVSWNWTRLLGPILAFGMLIHGVLFRTIRLPGLQYIGSFILYGAGLSFYFWQLYPEILPLVERARLIGWGRGQTELRYAVQYLVMVFNWFFLFGGMAFTRSADDRDAAMSAFVSGCILSVVVGLYQAIAQGNGLPWITPTEELAGFLGSRRVITTYEVAGGLQLTRLFGLGGEPKHTAAFVTLALAFLLASSLYDREFKVSRTKIIVLLLGLMLTLSTSGVLAFIFLCIMMLRSRDLFVTRNAFGALGAVLLIGVSILAISVVFGERTTTNLVEDRFSSRLSGGFDTIRRYEGKDAAALELLWDEPERVFFGHGSGGIDFHLIDRVPVVEREKQSMITPTYLLVRVLSEYGLVGLMLLLLMGWSWTQRLKSERSAALRVYFVALLLTALVQPTFVYPSVLFLLGTALGALVSESGTSSPSDSLPKVA